MIQINVGKTIRKIRKEKNLTQEDLASMADLDRTYIAGVEVGTRNISIRNLEKIMEALNISFSVFFKESEVDMNKYCLGTIEASEQLIKDLYISLRHEINEWSKITCQTPQARMGYIGQHLVSVVTGYPGGKSGARGYDLIMGNDEYGEIKTCYRVDQLGECADCGAVVSSLEKECSVCKSQNIIRKDDSKWLIGIRHEQEFSEILDPKRYYFVLFEFEDINDINNDNIVASIWEVDPKTRGFALCMIDYYLNIREKSKSKAPFNMWPHSLKFALTNPKLIYKSIIKGDGTIDTVVFPTKNNEYVDNLLSLPSYSSATTLTVNCLCDAIKQVSPDYKIKKNKKQLLLSFEEIRKDKGISNPVLCDLLANAIYLPTIKDKTDKLPPRLLEYYNNLKV